MTAIGLTGAVFVLAGVMVVVVLGGPDGIPFVAASGPQSKERDIVSAELREMYWNSTVRESRWWPPKRGGENHMSIRVRYSTTNANGIVLSHDELWMIPDGSNRATRMYDVSGP